MYCPLVNTVIRCLLATIVVVCLPTTSAGQTESTVVRGKVIVTEKAREIHRSALVIDGHNDLPWALRGRGGAFERVDIAEPQPELHTDIPRLKQGGVGAQFWSVFVPVSTMKTNSALGTTLEQIELVKKMMAKYPDVFELALSTDDIRRIRSKGKIASLIGVEGGHSIEDSLNVLRQLHRLGARYMTLTHSVSLAWADSCTDESRCHGLSKFGEEVVLEMNRLGMLVDISHVTPECMRAALRVSKAPVIFSHSSAKAIADHPRNVPDDVLRLTAKNGGVVMINFFTGFVEPAAAARSVVRFKYREKLESEFPDNEEKVRSELNKWDITNPMPNSTVHDILDHIEHVIRVAGIDHVGLGSDYDGVPVLPIQLEDVSTYPVITQGLLDRGYDAPQIRKVLGENLMRAFAGAEDVSRRMNSKTNGKQNPLEAVEENPDLRN